MARGYRNRAVAVAIVCWLAVCTAVDAQTRPATRTAGSGSIVSLDDLFAKLDVNHDGKISRDEATGVYARRFTSWDAGAKGYATREDIHNDRVARGIGDDGRRLGPTTRRAPLPKVAKLLLSPTNWRLEVAPVPPAFASDVGITGTDETRFSMKMYDTTSAEYFTYAKAMAIDGDVHWTEADVATFMDRYYRGLSASRARRTGATAHTDAKSTATTLPSGDDGAPVRFGAKVPFADSFTDGRQVMLNVELSLLPRPSLHKTYMVMLVSPSATDSPVWTHLRDIGKQAVKQMPAATTQP